MSLDPMALANKITKSLMPEKYGKDLLCLAVREEVMNILRLNIGAERSALKDSILVNCFFPDKDIGAIYDEAIKP